MCKDNRYLNIDQLRRKAMMKVEDPVTPNIPKSSTEKHSCPKCKESLSQIKYGKLSIDKCQYCQGIWLKDDQLEYICEHFSENQLDQLETIGKPKEKKQNFKKLFHFESKYNCPYCTSKLRQVYFQLDKSILLDICDRCQGVFYDINELKSVIKLINNNQASK